MSRGVELVSLPDVVLYELFTVYCCVSCVPCLSDLQIAAILRVFMCVDCSNAKRPHPKADLLSAVDSSAGKVRPTRRYKLPERDL